MTVRHVLLDADGVVQHGVRDPFALLRRWAGDRAEELGRALWAAERGPLRGQGDFLESVRRLVPSYADVDPDTLYESLWADITPSEATLALVDRLRGAGLGVHLGTNQHRQRGEHMRTVLGFDRLFDVSCYSWEMGTKKPEPDYFASRTCSPATACCSADPAGGGPLGGLIRSFRGRSPALNPARTTRLQAG